MTNLNSNSNSYSAEDLKVFEEYRNLYDWQKTLYEKIIAPDGEFNTADSSKIISVIDKIRRVRREKTHLLNGFVIIIHLI